MNDHEDDRPHGRDEPVPSFDDPSLDALRALLAEARVTEPVPAEVAARLDATLDSLQGEREQDAVVVPLRRRLAPRLVAAAAAVVVAGVGGVAVAQIARHGSSAGDSAASGTTSTADSGARSVAPSAPGTSLERTPQALTDAARAVPRLSTATFARDAAVVMRGLAPLSGGTSGSEYSAASPGSGADSSPSATVPQDAVSAPPVTASPTPLSGAVGRSLATCAGPVTTDAVTLPATLDGTPVALVFRAPTATGQLVEAWSCDGTALLAHATVPR